MKTIHVINPHSFVDVITNSSSELFVCGKGKTEDEVRNIISEYCPKLDGYVVRRINADEALFLKNKHLLTKVQNSNQYARTEYATPDYVKSREDAEALFGNRCYGEWNEKERKYDPPFYVEPERYLENLTEDSIIVESEGENSIDSDYFDLLESKLNAERYHI